MEYNMCVFIYFSCIAIGVQVGNNGYIAVLVDTNT